MGRTLGGVVAAPGSATRITQPRRMKLNQEQRDMSPDHSSTFSVPFPDYILDSPPMVSMPQTAQNVAEVYGLTREQMDEFTVKSHKKYGDACEKGIYKDEIIPLEVEDPVYDDEGNWVPDSKGAMITFDRRRGLPAGHELRGPRQPEADPGRRQLRATRKS